MIDKPEDWWDYRVRAGLVIDVPRTQSIGWCVRWWFRYRKDRNAALERLIRQIRRSDMEQTVKCNICGKPYVFMPHYAGDQSACPKCRAEARKQMYAPR